MHGDYKDIDCTSDPETKKSILTEVPIRFIITPFPSKDPNNGERSEYRREVNIGRDIYALTMKSAMPLTSPRFEKYKNDYLIPTGDIGYNIHALLIGDIRRAIKRGSYTPTIVEYKNIKEIADRIHVTAQTINRRRIEQIFYRFRWLTVIYEVNGKTVVGTRDCLIPFAETAADVELKDNDRRLALKVTDAYMRAFAKNTVSIKEDVYMSIPSAYGKYLYSWVMYGSKYAAAKQLVSYESELGQIVYQFTGKKISKNNHQYYKTETEKMLKEICSLDKTVEAWMGGLTVYVMAREKMINIKDETDEERTLTASPTLPPTEDELEQARELLWGKLTK